MIEDKFLEAVKNLREAEKNRKEKIKFNQSVDLIVNLKDFDARKESFTSFIQVPNKIKDKKIAGFFEKDNKFIDVITKSDFLRYKEKKDFKKLVKAYDFFVANAKLMPSVATTFGRYLGPVGKMPNPNFGIITNEEDNIVKNLIDNINSSVIVRVREPSIKVAVAKESLKDEEIAENALAVYNKILDTLPKKIDNIRNVKIKFTMAKPVNVNIK